MVSAFRIALAALAITVAAFALAPADCGGFQLERVVTGGADAIPRLQELLGNFEAMSALHPLTVDVRQLPSALPDERVFAVTDLMRINVAWWWSTTMHVRVVVTQSPPSLAGPQQHWTMDSRVTGVPAWLFASTQRWTVMADGTFRDDMLTMRTLRCLCGFSRTTAMDAHRALMDRIAAHVERVV